MAKRTSPNQKQTKSKKKVIRNNYRFRATDILLEDASATNPVVLNGTVNSSGFSYRNISLSPAGIVVPLFGTGNTVTNSNFDTAHLGWLRSTSVNFRKYRVLSATLIVDGFLLSSNTLGNLNIWSTNDVTDITSYGQSSIGTTGVNSRNISLASLATNNKRVPLAVDSSWKTVSPFTFYQGSVGGVVVGEVSTTSTINDLCFSHCAIAITNASTSSGINPVSYTVEYDVEFNGPITPFVNH